MSHFSDGRGLNKPIGHESQFLIRFRMPLNYGHAIAFRRRGEASALNLAALNRTAQKSSDSESGVCVSNFPLVSIHAQIAIGYSILNS